MQALGAKTYSAAVNLALAEVVRVRGVLGLRQAFGKNLWEGNLSEMREDRARAFKRRVAGRRRVRK